jgi:F subunit of K+-transporting ATPase (Potass_KdpF)
MNAVILASTTDNVVGLILALAVVAYLVIVLVFPEKF